MKVRSLGTDLRAQNFDLHMKVTEDDNFPRNNPRVISSPCRSSTNNTAMAVAIPGTNASAAPALTNQKTQPSQSLYIQNLPIKIQREDLRRALYMLFATYGPVIDVTVVKSAKMRGQAHLLFRDVQSATQAMRSCQGLEFFGREMVCLRNP